jgi:hypothetical protein
MFSTLDIFQNYFPTGQLISQICPLWVAFFRPLALSPKDLDDRAAFAADSRVLKKSNFYVVCSTKLNSSDYHGRD